MSKFKAMEQIDKLIDKKWLVLIFFTFLVFLCHGNSLFNDFVWDDHQIVEVDSNVPLGFSKIIELFEEPDVVYPGTYNPFYRPITRLSFVVDANLFGLNPVWFHFVNLVIHLFNMLLLFYVLKRVFDVKIAFLTSVSFGIHPINCETLNLIAARNNLLAMLFVLLCLFFLLKWDDDKKLKFFIFSILSFSLGLFCKETALMVLPFILIGAWFFPGELGRRFRFGWQGYAGFFVAVGVYLWFRTQALSGGTLGVGLDFGGIVERVGQNFYIIPKYLQLILLPYGLSGYYEIPSDVYALLPLYAFWAVIVLLSSWRIMRRDVVFLFGLVWFIVNLLPVSQIVPLGGASMADRYMYIPAIGFFVAIGSVFARNSGTIVSNKVILGVYSLLIIGWGVSSINQNRVWADDFSLFQNMVKVDPTSVFGNTSLAQLYLNKGDVDSAKKHWEIALDKDPYHSAGNNQLGNIYYSMGDYSKAKTHYLNALKIKNNSRAHFNLGQIYETLGENEKAVYHYREFLKNFPADLEYLIPKTKLKVLRLELSEQRNILMPIPE